MGGVAAERRHTRRRDVGDERTDCATMKAFAGHDIDLGIEARRQSLLDPASRQRRMPLRDRSRR